MELIFETKSKSYGQRHYADGKSVTIRLGTQKKDKVDIVTITIRNRWSDVISKTGYGKVAILENRLYFAEANEVDGWKFSEAKNNSDTRRIQICSNKNLIDWVREGGERDYDLKIDKDYNLYYIEKEVLMFEQPRRR